MPDEIRRMLQGGTTLRGIAAALNHRAFRTQRGSAWRLEHVARIVKQVATGPLDTHAFAANAFLSATFSPKRRPSSVPRTRRASLEHPKEPQLRDYCRGAIDRNAVEQIDRHLANCERCSHRVVEIIRSKGGMVRSRPQG